MQLAIVLRNFNPENEASIAWIMIKDVDLLPIIQIAFNVSGRGLGLSLQDAIQKTDYAILRPKIDTKQLVRLLRELPDYVTDWIMYSEDKRTPGGWYLLEKSKEIGALEIARSRKRHKSIEDAVANFILKELDSCVD